MKPDFSGYATKNGIKCTDGRVINRDAFKHNDGARVPLVYQHRHRDIENVLGYVKLENRSDGVYAYGFFNETPKAQHAKKAVVHGDLNSLSIYANNLEEHGNHVVHGNIKEVSLVLSGANSGAKIDTVSIQHSDGEIEDMYDEAIINFGGSLYHSEDGAPSDDGGAQQQQNNSGDEFAWVDSLTDDQAERFMEIINAYEEQLNQYAGAVQHSDDYGEVMNVFENGDKAPTQTLSHSDLQVIFDDAKELGSLKKSVLAHADEYGIGNLELLFPEFKNIENEPEFISRQQDWVKKVMAGVRKVPFTRIRSMHADITHEEARARGYIKGNMKKEEFFDLKSRETSPTTIYKKQRLDRDDIIDVTTMDVVAWLKSEMRLMLDEEIARAILIGDGRDAEDVDKISETKIRPIAKDAEFYAPRHVINNELVKSQKNDDLLTFVDEIVMGGLKYKGNGTPILFMSKELLTRLMLVKDTTNRRLFSTESELASAMRVSEIVPCDFLDANSNGGVLAIMVNLSDYSVGSDRGGEINFFDDFDIDYNQQVYLYETRLSAALTRYRSAVVFVTKSATYSQSEDNPTPTYEENLAKANRRKAAFVPTQTTPKGGS